MDRRLVAHASAAASSLAVASGLDVTEEVAIHYPGIDPALLQECRRLVLAMVAAWRWDARDAFPDGPRHAVRIVALLRDGPPWPVLGSLTSA